MVKAEEDVAFDILEHVIWSGLFNNRRSEVVLRMTIISESSSATLLISACCMRTRAYEKIVDNARRLAQIHQFRNEPFHICLAACGGGGSKASAALQNLQFQKFLHRELRIHDDVVKGRKLNYSAIMNRWTTVLKAGVNRMPGEEVEQEDDDDDAAEEGDAQEGRDSEEAAPKPTKVSPVLNVLYGQHMLGAKAYQSALCECASCRRSRQSTCSERMSSYRKTPISAYLSPNATLVEREIARQTIGTTMSCRCGMLA